MHWQLDSARKIRASLIEYLNRSAQYILIFYEENTKIGGAENSTLVQIVWSLTMDNPAYKLDPDKH